MLPVNAITRIDLKKRTLTWEGILCLGFTIINVLKVFLDFEDVFLGMKDLIAIVDCSSFLVFSFSFGTRLFRRWSPEDGLVFTLSLQSIWIQICKKSNPPILWRHYLNKMVSMDPPVELISLDLYSLSEKYFVWNLQANFSKLII